MACAGSPWEASVYFHGSNRLHHSHKVHIKRSNSLGLNGYGATTVAMTIMMTTVTMMGPGTAITSDQEERVRNASGRPPPRPTRAHALFN